MNLIRISTFAGALAFSALPAAPVAAQTMAEAAWSNAALALQYCTTGAADGPTRASWFRTAGFSETVERSGENSDTTHIFTAPGDTVSVELYYGEMPQHCIVSSMHMGVSLAGQLLDALIPQVFPTYVRRENPGDQAVCVTYEDPANPIGHIIGVVAKQSQQCVEDGTVEFYSSYRV